MQKEKFLKTMHKKKSKQYSQVQNGLEDPRLRVCVTRMRNAVPMTTCMYV